MKKNLPLLLILCLLIATSACTLQPADEPAALPPDQIEIEEDIIQVEPYPFLGIWFSEDRTSQLIITDTYLYFHDFAADREVYAQVVAVNVEEHSIDLRMQNILHSGQQMGFDSPMMSVQYQISMQGMEVWLNRLVVSGGDQPVLYLHDEVLNP
ncbi:MAG: hypothetical protein ABFS17_09600 [Chloroflexota bacterium]